MGNIGSSTPFNAPQVLTKHLTENNNAGNVAVATASIGPVIVDSIVLHSITALTPDANYVAVSGGASQIIKYIDPVLGRRYNLNGIDKEIIWAGASRLKVADTITATFNGTSGTDVNLQIVITYHAETSAGGLLS
jgi:hypothetical protein